MSASVSPEQLIRAFQRDWPMQYEITTLRLLAEVQAERIAELEISNHSTDESDAQDR